MEKFAAPPANALPRLGEGQGDDEYAFWLSGDLSICSMSFDAAILANATEAPHMKGLAQDTDTFFIVTHSEAVSATTCLLVLSIKNSLRHFV